jgi:antirestriction protein ArdC
MKMKPYEIIINQILEKINKWIIPWNKTWLWWIPINYENNKEYRWLNKLILLFDDYEDKRYLTAKQVNDLWWYIKKWEKATKIIFYKYNSDKENEKVEYFFPIIRYYNIFNIEQIAWINFNINTNIKIENETRYNRAKQIIEWYIDKPNIINWNNPCYIPSRDIIKIPSKDNFNTLDDYYSTLFHELIHSTWSVSRLNRFKNKVSYYWNKDYSFEELVAEIWAMFLSQDTWILRNTENNSISYISWWVKYLGENQKNIIRASVYAQKAVDYIYNK